MENEATRSVPHVETMVKTFLGDLFQEWEAVSIGTLALALTITGALLGNKALLWALAATSLICYLIAAYRTWKGAMLNPLIREADSFIDTIAELRFANKDSDSVRRPFSSRSVPVEIKEEQHKELIRLFVLVQKHIEKVEHLSLGSEFMTRFKDQNGRNMDAHEAVTLLKDHKEVLVRKKRALI